MAVTPEQCGLMYAQYKGMKSKALNVKNVLKGKGAGMVGAFEGVTDDDLDDVGGLISGVVGIPAEIDTSLLTTDLEGSLDTCPALVYVIPPDVISKVNAGATDVQLPTADALKYTKSLVGGVETDIQSALPVNSNSAMGKYKEYSGFLQKTKIGSMLTQINDLENCLEGSCGLIEAPDKVADSIASELHLDSNYDLSLDSIGASSGRSVSSLTSSVTSYKEKFGQYF